MKYCQLLLLGVFCLYNSGCAQHQGHKSAPVPKELQQLQEYNFKTSRNQELAAAKHLRYTALEETALSLGARSGLHYRTEQINQDLEQRYEELDAIFNFNALLLRESILPPVLVEAEASLNMASGHSLRLADKNYRIVKQARFVTTAPNWRDYLTNHTLEPETPDASLLPKDKTERQVWQQAIKKGWQQGLEQADAIYDENLNRLKRDFQGMVRYKLLLAQNMVSEPMVSTRELGVTGGGDQLAINDKIIAIDALPSLQADSSKWQPTVVH